VHAISEKANKETKLSMTQSKKIVAFIAEILKGQISIRALKL
jgi:hypothetical protein